MEIINLADKQVMLKVQYIPDNKYDESIVPYLVKGVIVKEITPFNDTQKIFHIHLNSKIKGKTIENINYRNIIHVFVIISSFDLAVFLNNKEVFCMLGYFSSQELNEEYNSVSDYDNVITDSAKILLLEG